MTVFRNSWVIHAFALLHAVTALGCRFVGITDDIALTLLSMIMVLLICLNRKMDVRFMAIWVVLANVIGSLLGFAVSHIIMLEFSSPLVIHPLTTIICTEFIGWCVEISSKRFSGTFGVKDSTRPEDVRWILVAFVLLLVVRFSLLLIRNGGMDGKSAMASVFVDYIFSCGAMLMVSEYAVRYGREAVAEREKANLAQYRYMMLKQQVNPHFLFNSLNILDYMVLENETAQASGYIHKLADVYRYMIRNDEETLVSLGEELGFIKEYVDLLKVRFGDAVSVDIDIPEQLLSRKVVPCSLQVLIENATKHNSLSSTDPLKVRIFTEADSLTVVNELHPKLGQVAPSTGLGLKYIRRQYADLSGRDVVVLKTDGEFRVTIPIL